MILIRSVVGKLWFTILLLVSFVLFILTVMLLEYFDNYNIVQTKNDLTKTAEKISTVLEERGNNNFQLGLEISWEILDDVTRVVIVKDKNEIYYSPNTVDKKKLTFSDIQKDKELSKVFDGHTKVEKVSILSSDQNAGSYSIVGVPLHLSGDKNGAVFIYKTIKFV
jgi:two-component system sensor histidine kinase ResE